MKPLIRSVKRLGIFGIPLFLLALQSATAQQKYEREMQISVDELPQTLEETIRPFLNNARKIKYYLETDGDRQSYEIKFGLEGRKYSVEFSNDLLLEDVEVVIGLKNIDSELLSKIKEHFDEYDRYKIKRIQKQFSSQTRDASTVIKTAIANEDSVEIRYEIVADLKEGKIWSTKELLFNDKGQLVNSRDVINRAEDFILFR